MSLDRLATLRAAGSLGLTGPMVVSLVLAAGCGAASEPPPPSGPRDAGPPPPKTDVAAPTRADAAPTPAPAPAPPPPRSDAAPARDSAPVADAGPAMPAPPSSSACGVDPMRILADVRQLASPALRGRKPGDPGNELAVKYAEQQFAAAGLAPAGDEGSYRQAFAYRPGAITHNVVGVIKGNDFTLAKQVVIVGGHIDHLGVNRDGAINYGADDNASGTAMVFELARLYKLCGLSPKRTMVFVAWNAEEMGLIGSRAYVEKPLFPLASTLGVYNFDMVGAGDGTGALVFGGNDRTNAWMTELLRATAAAAKLPHAIQVVPQKLASDHAPFVEKGVPSLFGFARPDPHPGYHTPADDIDNVSPSSLATIGELFWATLRPLALGEEATYLKRSLAPGAPMAAAASAADARVARPHAPVRGDVHAPEVVFHGCGVPVTP